MMPGSFCSPELLAHIVFQKYCQAVPLYRQEKEFEALGVKLSRTTIANWIMVASKLWIEPIWKAMKAELLASNVIHADETTVQVLNEPNRKATTKSRMWVFCAQRKESEAVSKGGCAPENALHSPRSNILFDYHPTRSGNHAAKFLGDYSGYINNRAENAIRPFVIGRKNWMFSASVKGADAGAMLYSGVATACANGKKVEEYLTQLFREKPGFVVMPQ